MKQQFYRFLFSVCLSVLCLGSLISCGKKDTAPPPGTMPVVPVATPQEVVWTFEKNAITLHIESAENLNYVNNEAHTVSLCVYQSPDSNSVQTLAQTEEGLKELLKCQSASPDRLQATQFYVPPATSLEQSLDRAEGAKFLIVVAGFNQLTTQNCFAIFPFPMHTQTERKYLVKKETLYSPGKLDARIDLTADSINLQGVENVQK